MSAESYGYPHYNKKKPNKYIADMYAAKIRSIDFQIKKLQIEKEAVIQEMEYITKKIIHNDGK
jgi:hypothetical protein